MKTIAFLKVLKKPDGTFSVRVYDGDWEYFATVDVDRSLLLAMEQSAPYVLELEGRGVLS